MSILADLDLHGVRVPAFFYGTAWKEDQTTDCVRQAIGAGFRAIDTANQRKHYFEAGVGKALKMIYDQGELSRNNFFLQTKFTYQAGQDHRLPYDPDASYTDQVAQSFASSLEHLGTDYIDSYVLHGPAVWPELTEPDLEVWQAMETLHDEKKTRLLGVSNVNIDQLIKLYEAARIKPAFVQNRCFAKLGWDRYVREFCNTQGIMYQGFSLLTANRTELSDSRITVLAQQLDRSIAQIVFRFARQLGMLPLTGTTDPIHMGLDRQIDDFSLSDSQMRLLENISPEAKK